jgi:hypothetical protein
LRELTAAITCTLLAVGCTGLRPAGAGLPVLPLEDDAMPFERLQAIELQGPDGRAEALLGALERGAGRATLAVMTPLGLRLFTVTQDASGLDVRRAAILPAAVDPEGVFAQVQFVNWPIEELQAGLPPGWRAVEREGVRTLLHHDREVVRAEWLDAATVELTGTFIDHRLRVRTIEAHGVE